MRFELIEFRNLLWIYLCMILIIIIVSNKDLSILIFMRPRSCVFVKHFCRFYLYRFGTKLKSDISKFKFWGIVKSHIIVILLKTLMEKYCDCSCVIVFPNSLISLHYRRTQHDEGNMK